MKESKNIYSTPDNKSKRGPVTYWYSKLQWEVVTRYGHVSKWFYWYSGRTSKTGEVGLYT